MSESTLETTYTELKQEIGHYLGLTRDTTAWDTEETADVEVMLKRALRQFYFPAPVMEDGRISQRPHDWSFLKPVTTIDTIAPYDTGTIAITVSTTTVVLTTGVWPSWTATHGSLIVNNTEYVIASRTSDTDIELAESWTEDTETAAEFVLKHDGNYDLPDDYGGMEGYMVVESTNFKPEIVLVGEGRIRAWRQQMPVNVSTTSTGTPQYAAVRPKVHSVTTTGQRYEIMFYPIPSTVETISYKMRVLPDKLVDTTLTHPYGGTAHAETLLAACLAVAEEQGDDNKRGGSPVTDKKKLFDERLAASIQFDKRINSVEQYGYNGDNSDVRHRLGPDDHHHHGHRHCNGNIVTYTPGS